MSRAKGILDRFKAAYIKSCNPRILIYVNRELVDEHAGLKLESRKERTEHRQDTGNVESKRAKSENTRRTCERATATLADKQTVRDMERLFGRRLRMVGASLVDH